MKITSNNVELKRIDKLKYLSCYFHEQSGRYDISFGIRIFRGDVNDILSVFLIAFCVGLYFCGVLFDLYLFCMIV